jgi:hypothetical protein
VTEDPIPIPPRGKRTPWIVAAAATFVVLLCAALIALGAARGASTTATAATSEPTATYVPDEEVSTEAAAMPTTEPTPGPTLKAADLELTPKVTEKQCFGSAGCNVTVQVEVGYSGPALDPDDTWEVTYEVTGDEDGPVIGTFELTGDKYDQDEVSLSTHGSKTKITIKITDVSKVA